MAMVMAGGTSVGTLPQATRRDFSGVGYDEAMRRARALVPTLRERAQQTALVPRRTPSFERRRRRARIVEIE